MGGGCAQHLKYLNGHFMLFSVLSQPRECINSSKIKILNKIIAHMLFVKNYFHSSMKNLKLEKEKKLRYFCS